MVDDETCPDCQGFVVNAFLSDVADGWWGDKPAPWPLRTTQAAVTVLSWTDEKDAECWVCTRCGSLGVMTARDLSGWS